MFVLFSKRSFVGSAKLILNVYKTCFFILSTAEVSFCWFSKRSFLGSAKLILNVYKTCFFILSTAEVSFCWFSKRSFVGSAKLILNVYKTYFFILSTAEVSFCWLSKRSFVGSAKLILNVYKTCFFIFAIGFPWTEGSPVFYSLLGCRLITLTNPYKHWAKPYILRTSLFLHSFSISLFSVTQKKPHFQWLTCVAILCRFK